MAGGKKGGSGGSAEDPPLYLGLSGVCLRGLKCTKGSLWKKEGGLSLNKRWGVGVQYKKKIKKGPGGGGSAKREERGGGWGVGSNFQVGYRILPLS